MKTMGNTELLLQLAMMIDFIVSECEYIASDWPAGEVPHEGSTGHTDALSLVSHIMMYTYAETRRTSLKLLLYHFMYLVKT